MKVFIYLASTVLLIFQPSYSQADESFPTHCKPDEYAYLNAKMAPFNLNEKGYFTNKKNGKILSLCTDKPEEPFSKLVYRYGSIGRVEMEKTATTSNNFYIYGWIDHPVWNETIFFNVGKFSYYITEAKGQGHGVSLTVYNSGQNIFNLFSGLELESDYQSGATEINFEKVSSPILKIKNPKLNEH